MNGEILLQGFLVIVGLASLTWVLSVVKRDVSIVDSAWSLMFLAAATLYLLNGDSEARQWLIFGLVAAWALRLSLYITLRSWGEDEDHRYQEIREKYSPGFAWKSFFIIFLFQAVLAMIVTLPLGETLTQTASWSMFDAVAVILVLFGLVYESVADYQLHRFKSDENNRGKVLNTGLWRNTRHPNYFGEFLVWWGFFFFAVAQGDYWTIVSPLLMTFLLLKFSGVSLLESSIRKRRPEYQAYIEETNAFFPGPTKRKTENQTARGVHS